MSTRQTTWPCYPVALPCELAAPGLLFADYSGAMPGPGPVMPYYYNTAIRHAEEIRKFCLERSVLDLVEANHILPLTDPKLLGWYLGLPLEDRKLIQDEGGFQQFLERHPGLDRSKHHIYVRYNIGGNSCAPLTSTSNKNKSRTSGAKKLTYELQMNPQNFREPHKEICCAKHAVNLQDHFQTAYNGPFTKPSHHQNEYNVSLLSQLREEEPAVYMAGSYGSGAVCKGPAALSSCFLDAEPDRFRQKGQPELTSQMSGPDFTNTETHPLHRSGWSAVKDGLQYHSLDKAEMESNYRSLIQSAEPEQDDSVKSIKGNKRPSITLKSHTTPVASLSLEGPVTPGGEVAIPSRETLKADQYPEEKSTADKSTSMMPSAPACDIMVGTELIEAVSAFTQTDGPATADKNIMTEVHMADLDYVAEKFIKLKAAQELRDQEEKIKRPKDPPVNVVTVLQTLESDYNQMRDKIPAGVPLELLKPLSVDSEKICTGTTYIPKPAIQTIGDVLGNAPPCNPLQTQNHQTPSEGNGCSHVQNASGWQDSQGPNKLANIPRENISKSRNAVTLVPQQRGRSCRADTSEDGHSTGECTELSVSETWYDAEEDLHPSVSAVAAEMEEQSKESTSEESQSSVLCLSNLPSHVTESDVMLPFGKYRTSEVSISTLKNDSRVGKVTVSCPQSAAGAVADLNGCSVQGHTSHVQHINPASAGSQSRTSTLDGGPEPSQDTTKTDSAIAETKLTPGSSINSRRMVCISPTAKGTFVPQHYGTMGGFDILMAELMQHHPDAGRQRIVEALVELGAEYKGVLVSLPLSTIRQMTSDLLNERGPPSSEETVPFV